MNDKAIQAQVQAAPVQQASATPMDLIANAIANDVSIDKIDKLMDLKERWDKSEAEKAYNAAIAQFKSENIIIIKDGTVDFTSSKGRTCYRFETLANVVYTVAPVLAKYGLNHSWHTEQEGGQVRVSCKLAHAMGHSESISLQAGPDNSGSKNPIQAIKSTVSYLQRITLTSILGLAAGDQDDDARGAYQEQEDDPAQYITESQAADLQSLMEEVGADETGFLSWMQVPSIERIRKEHLKRAIAALEKKRT
jgi:hypothetical protein